ncbi:haloacid dehalogenase superfamily, subfamily IA, variant 3 with third motif having DD or ED [Gemmobacter aquatilis]|uniref:Haloacid dehalogenase superfamily, subfamily IA, variant 3 with third motif having DD or ED n=1 Tax=Gemmobacter aquatilis TaxID=933059 RepID=A0A1H8MXL5_9RHOB|nr:HAD family phosphatase [Gemmobacter aquatilis]SEO21978.1 haloacid dehalogenase superfamily, subfamily IA, variant 3 with third motif having DD or ED [Gemmobacter aquatilis]
MTIKAVLWDMDGTLADSEHIAVEALRLAMVEAGLQVPDDLYETVVGCAADDLYHRFVRDLGLSLPPVVWEQRKHAGYFAAIGGLRGFEDALATWRRFEAAGIAQAVVSNSDRMIVDANLRAIGLSRPGLISVSRNDLRQGKPAAEGYLRALWLLDCTPDQAVVVEDSASGAAAGLAAGIRTVFVPHATVAAPAGVEALTDMAALERLVLP